MNAEIIAVGSELLLGQITNTNARFLSQHLAEIGVNIYYHTVVGDNKQRLEEAVKLAQKRADLIIFSGGLGPTKDDLTKETIAQMIGTTLEYNEEALEGIQSYFDKTGRMMTDNNKKQALVIKDSIVLKNDNGMAPGMFVKSSDKYYMLLPGPPREMQPMFLNYGRPEILNVMEKVERIESRVLRFFGIGESALETEIDDILMKQTNPTIAPLAGDGEVTLRITAKHESPEEAVRMIQQAEDEILERVGHYFYGYDETTIAAELAGKLKDKQLTIAAAESLTGGLFLGELTAIPGMSAHVKGGVICYTNEVKELVLGVKKETLTEFGAVSKECAKELAENVRKLCGSRIGISFTGAAGPDSLEGHEPGTVFLAIAAEGQETIIHSLKMAGSRDGVRKRTVRYGCHYLLQLFDHKQ
ncbi:competence/damage-inducible protein A [Domibacillus epiphyticus]|uniref:Putative competence-damage inducible protein n=1 Tax=Domibacillus epiphyticus TaxID=1714355 RepID=A0A1V2ACD7_9BACI|nr:competence/damage-inducible protein A [Domibacillus epiphyticus]OMP68663.1 competence/damage-inducible protein A [Domibacillus epiphyticus]